MHSLEHQRVYQSYSYLARRWKQSVPREATHALSNKSGCKAKHKEAALRAKRRLRIYKHFAVLVVVQSVKLEGALIDIGKKSACALCLLR